MTQGVRVRPTDLGWIAVGLGLAATLAIGLVRGAGTTEVGPGLSTGSTIALTVLLAGPAIVGAIGTSTRRREVLVGAGLAYLPLTVLSFTGITLMLFVPAILFLYAGLRTPGASDATAGTMARPGIALAIAGLLTIGLIGLFATTSGSCWEQSADGTIRQVEVPSQDVRGDEGVMSVGQGDIVASGCSSGVISVTGLVIVLACVGASVGLAIRVGRAPG